jgi:hypothetical protein
LQQQGQLVQRVRVCEQRGPVILGFWVAPHVAFGVEGQARTGPVMLCQVAAAARKDHLDDMIVLWWQLLGQAHCVLDYTVTPDKHSAADE